jgi:hypothetical protein
MTLFLNSTVATFDLYFCPAQCSCKLCSLVACTWQMSQVNSQCGFLTGIVISVISHFTEGKVFFGCMVYLFDMQPAV